MLDVAPTARARLAPERLAQPLGERVLRSHPWLAVADLPALAGRDAAGARALADELVAGGQAVRIGGHLVAADALAALRTQVRPLVAAHHREQPLEAGPELSSLASRLRVPAEQLEAALRDVPDLVVERGRVRSEDHHVVAADDPEAVRYLEALAAQPFSPPSAAELGVRPEIVRALVRSGHVVDLEGVVLAKAAVDDARRLVVDAIRRDGSITVAGARDVLGSSRKYVLAILGHFDKTGVTRRHGDDRTAGPRADG